MDNTCPRKCTAALQRPLEQHELSQLSNIIRAEIALLQQTAFLCETCGSVYANSRSGTANFGKLPQVWDIAQADSNYFPAREKKI